MIKKIDKNFITIEDENEKIEYKITSSILKEKFKLPYALTCDSVQGLSFDDNEKVTIFDSESAYVDRKFLYTAITRTRDLKNIQIFLSSDYGIELSKQSKYKQYFTFKTSSYKTQDRKAKRTIEETIEYVDEPWLNEKLKGCKNICQQCNKFMEIEIDYDGNVSSNITVDRIDSKLPHYKHNCQILCLSCNQSKSNRNY